MTLGISSFMMNTSGNYSNTQAWGTTLLSNLATAISTASGGNYQIDSTVEIINRSMSPNNSYCRHTIQLKNDYTGEYLRMWYFSRIYEGMTMLDSAGSNTSISACKIYKGNFLCQGINGSLYYHQNGLFFAIKNASIGTDPATDLGLSFPMFSLCNGLYTTNRSRNEDLVDGSYKSKYVITSDGSGFTFLYHMFNGSYPYSCRGLVYHPDAISTVSGDSHKEGVYLLSIDSSSDYPYDGNNGVTKLRGYWVSAGGVINYGQFLNSLDPVDATYVTTLGNKVSCIPLMLVSEPDNYNVSQSYLNATGTAPAGSFPDNSIGFKGYTNQNLIRRCSAQRVINIGATYGGWMCIGPGWLVPWATGHDTDSPFIDSSATQSGGGGDGDA